MELHTVLYIYLAGFVLSVIGFSLEVKYLKKEVWPLDKGQILALIGLSIFWPVTLPVILNIKVKGEI